MKTYKVTYYNNSREIIIKIMSKMQLNIFTDINNVQIINVKQHDKQ